MAIGEAALEVVGFVATAVMADYLTKSEEN